METTNPRTETKTILLVGGDKGGVGKSTVARAIADYLKRKSASYAAFDGDDTNPTFLRFFPDAQRIHTKSVKGFEPLINGLEGKHTYQLVDLGAGTSIMLNRFVDETGFLDLAHDFQARVVLVFVLAPSADSVGLLKTVADQLGKQIGYVIARNNAIPGTWDLWESSKIRKKLIDDLDAVEITIPLLDAEAFSLVDRHSLTWSAASSDERLSLATRSYVHRWSTKVFQEFDRLSVLADK